MSENRIVFGPFPTSSAIRFKEAKNSAGQLYLQTLTKSLSAVGIGDLASWDDPRVSVIVLPAHHLLEVDYAQVQATLGGLHQKRYQFKFRQSPAGGTVGYAAIAQSTGIVCTMPDCDGSDNCELNEEAVCSGGHVACVPPPPPVAIP